MNGVQRYRCWVCGKQFVGGERIDTARLWQEYTGHKQAYSQLAERYGCSPRTIKRRLDAYTPPRRAATPGVAIVVMDTTYWGREHGVMLFMDALTGRDQLWYFVKSETYALYARGVAELEGMGYEIPAVVFDGRKGLPKMFPGKMVQLCQFHQQKTVRRYITKHLKTEAAVELKQLVDLLAKTDRESFEGDVRLLVCQVGRLPQGADHGFQHGQELLYAQKAAKRVPKHQAEPAAAVHLI